MFYAAVGDMVAAEHDPRRREDYLARLMAPPNASWAGIIAAARADAGALRAPDVVRSVANILQTNAAVCGALGAPFAPQMAAIFVDMLAVYRAYSELISAAVAAGGPHAARTSAVKGMRSAKRVALKLVEAFVAACDDPDALATRYLPAMLDPLLGDYARAAPDARDPEVLSLLAALAGRLGARLEPEVPRLLEAVFEPTLAMITANMEDFPEHRLHLFGLLRALAAHAFPAIAALPPPRLALVMDAVVWALRHTERNAAEAGLHLLLELLQRVDAAGGAAATAFYSAFFLRLLREVFAVLTDTFHKPGFKLQARILHHLFGVAARGDLLQAPLWDAAALGPAAFPDNAAFVRAHVGELLASSFPNLRPQQVAATVLGMVQLREPAAFRAHLRDFLVQADRFADQNNADLYADEVAAAAEAERARLAAIPGMVHPGRPDAAGAAGLDSD